MQSGAMCAQEPAVPTKLHQDVTRLGVILVSITGSVSHPVCIVPHTMGGPKVAVFEAPWTGDFFEVVPGPKAIP